MAVLLILLCVFGTCFGQGVPAPPEYGLTIESPVYECSDEASLSWVDTSKVDVKWLDEDTACMTGSIIFKKGMEPDTRVEMKIEKEMQGGRYEMVLSHEILDLCAELEDEESPYKTDLEYFGFPKKCPFEGGEYKVHDFEANTDEIEMTPQTEGRYIATISLFKKAESGNKSDDEFIACLKMEVMIGPK